MLLLNCLCFDCPTPSFLVVVVVYWRCCRVSVVFLPYVYLIAAVFVYWCCCFVLGVLTAQHLPLLLLLLFIDVVAVFPVFCLPYIYLIAVVFVYWCCCFVLGVLTALRLPYGCWFCLLMLLLCSWCFDCPTPTLWLLFLFIDAVALFLVFRLPYTYLNCCCLCLLMLLPCFRCYVYPTSTLIVVALFLVFWLYPTPT